MNSKNKKIKKKYHNSMKFMTYILKMIKKDNNNYKIIQLKYLILKIFKIKIHLKTVFSSRLIQIVKISIMKFYKDQNQIKKLTEILKFNFKI